MSGGVVGMEALLAVYLDGFCTGAGSALATLTPSIPEEERDRFVMWLAEGAAADPALAETMREEIMERLNGIDTGPKNLRLIQGDL